MTNIVAQLKLTDNSYKDFDRNKLKSLSMKKQVVAYDSLYEGQIDVGDGNITILDSNKQILTEIDNGIIQNNNVEFNIKTNGKVTYSGISSNSEYNLETNEYSISLSTPTEFMSRINYNGFAYANGIPVATVQSCSVWDILVDILGYAGYNRTQIENMCDNYMEVCNTDNSFSLVSIMEYLQSIVIEYPYIQPDTVFNSLNKICKLAQISFTESTDGVLKFVSIRPFSTQDPNSIISVDKHNQYSILDRDIFINNKYSSLEITDCKNFVLSNDVEKFYTLSIVAYDNNGNFVATDTENYNSQYKSVGVIRLGSNPDGTTNGKTYVGFNKTFSIKNLFDGKSAMPDSVDSEYVIRLIKRYQGKDDVITQIYRGSSWTVGDPDTVFFDVNDDGTVIIQPFIVVRNGTGSSVVTENPVLSFDIEIYKRTFKYEDTTRTFGVIDNSSLNIVGNELFINTATFGETPFVETFASNVLYDFRSGVMRGEIKTGCLDYYDLSNTIVLKNWKEGETIGLNDSVIIKNTDNSIWKVIGVDFSSSGDTFQNLSVVKTNQKHSPLHTIYISKDNIVNLSITKYSNNSIEGPKTVKNGDIIYNNDIINISANCPLGYRLSITINNELITSVHDTALEYQLSINDNVYISAIAVDIHSYTLSKGVSTVTRTESIAGGRLGILTDNDLIFEYDKISIDYTGDIRQFSITMSDVVIDSGSDLKEYTIHQEIIVNGDVAVSIVLMQLHWNEYKTNGISELNYYNSSNEYTTVAYIQGLLTRPDDKTTQYNKKEYSFTVYWRDQYGNEQSQFISVYGVDAVDEPFVGSGVSLELVGGQEVYIQQLGPTMLSLDCKNNNELTISVLRQSSSYFFTRIGPITINQLEYN